MKSPSPNHWTAREFPGVAFWWVAVWHLRPEPPLTALWQATCNTIRIFCYKTSAVERACLLQWPQRARSCLKGIWCFITPGKHHLGGGKTALSVSDWSWAAVRCQSTKNCSLFLPVWTHVFNITKCTQVTGMFWGTLLHPLPSVPVSPTLLTAYFLHQYFCFNFLNLF